jgi:hypothetical protein
MTDADRRRLDRIARGGRFVPSPTPADLRLALTEMYRVEALYDALVRSQANAAFDQLVEKRPLS